MIRNIDSIIAMYFSSSKVDRVKGKNWYSNAYSIACTLGKKYGVHSNTVSAVIICQNPMARNTVADGLQWSANTVRGF